MIILFRVQDISELSCDIDLASMLQHKMFANSI